MKARFFLKKYDLSHGAAPSSPDGPRRSLPTSCLTTPSLSCEQATPFLIGCGVAAAAYATRGALTVGQMLAENPNTAKTAQAAAAGFRAVGNRFKLSSIAEQVAVMRGGAAVGFDASMSRSEAAKILGLKENAAKPQIKEAHRKVRAERRQRHIVYHRIPSEGCPQKDGRRRVPQTEAHGRVRGARRQRRHPHVPSRPQRHVAVPTLRAGPYTPAHALAPETGRASVGKTPPTLTDDAPEPPRPPRLAVHRIEDQRGAATSRLLVNY